MFCLDKGMNFGLKEAIFANEMQERNVSAITSNIGKTN